ncbi:MAG: D-alanine--D-alanine ligase [Flavobacteriales bacterium]
MKQSIAVVYGGYSGESAVSEKSAQMILENIDRSKYEVTPVHIDKNAWKAIINSTEYDVNRGDFSVDTPDGNIRFEKVFNIIHGTPGEDGILQGYFEMIGMPHTSSDVFAMSLTFNKSANNTYLKQFGFRSAKSVILRQTDHYSTSKIINQLGLPCFVKPNEGGSSIGISKVKAAHEMAAAIEMAFRENDEVLIEEFISGREVSCGVIKRHGRPLALPLTEMIPFGEFFDYEAKYEGNSEEVTPADIPEELTLQIQNIAVEVYEILRCNGMIRIDFLLNEKGPYLIEVNTVPGFSDTSLVPQQAAAAGISKKDLITLLLQE